MTRTIILILKHAGFLCCVFLHVSNCHYHLSLSLSLSLSPPSLPLRPATLKLGEFHQSFLGVFAPIVEAYIDELEATLIEDLTRSFAVETWMPVRYAGRAAMM